MVKCMCRVCGAYADQEDSLKIFENPDILFSIQALTVLVLENSECLPKLICNCCQKELRDAIKFSERVIAVQKRLLLSLTEKELQELSEDYREAVKDSSGKSNQNATNIFEAHSESTNINEPKAAEELIIKQEENEIFVEEEAELQESQNTYDEYQFAIANKDYERPALYILPDKGSDEVSEVLDRVLKDDPDEKQFECNLCKNRFCSRSELKHHLSTHPEGRRYPCQYCKRSFKDSDSRTRHERSHTNERPYPCEICGKDFTTKYVLKNHMLTHSGLRSYRCELCDKSFMLKTHLRRHVRTGVHNRTLQTKQVQNDPLLRLKLKMQQEHSHSKGSPYPCEYMCGKAFATKYNLKNHMLIHSGIRSYKCEICDSSFKLLSHLSTHLRNGLHRRALEKFEMEQQVQDEITHQLKLEMNEESLHIQD